MTAPTAAWLTIPEVCAHLQITDAEWNEWRMVGQTPLHAAGSNGQLKLRAVDLERWLEALAAEPADELTSADIAADWEARCDEEDATTKRDVPGVEVVQLRPRRAAPGRDRRIEALSGLSQWEADSGDDDRNDAS